MRTVALISGGKDSCFNMMCCVAEGHDIVALAHLRPDKKDELDSYMYQTVGHTAIDLYAEAMGLPLFQRTIMGSSVSVGKTYVPQEDDEVEDLFKLLQQIKDDMEVDAVSVGAILSDYQRVRVENVCRRLNLTVLSFLWRRDQETLLKEMIDCGVKAKIIKVAAMGLDPKKHLGLELDEIFPHLLHMKSEYGLNECGEGGEYETFVCDCPLFKKRIVIEDTKKVIHSDDAFAPVAYLNLTKCHLEDKEWDDSIPVREKILQLPIMTSNKWAESHVSECSVLTQEDGDGDTHAKTTNIVLCVPIVTTGDDQPCVLSDDTNFQVSGIRAIVLEGSDLTAATMAAMNLLIGCLHSQGLKVSDISSVSLYVGDMANFALINSVYSMFFNTNPPVRLCVQATLPRNIALQLDCQGRVTCEHSREEERRVLHVQGLSHWAPANIGPYSQAVLAEDKLYLAGVIPLVPATLEVIKGGIACQCSVALIHVQQVMAAVHKPCTLACCPLVMCYLTSAEYIETARMEWLKALEETKSECEPDKLSPMVQYCVVPALPKGVMVEWHVMAWPFIDEYSDIKEISLKEDYDRCVITSKAAFSREQPERFSCHISVDLHSLEDYRHVEAKVLVSQLLDQYCKVCSQRGPTQALPPLAKVLFCPTAFDYLYLYRVFSEAISGLGGINCSPFPLVSLVPVSSLQTMQQILAWCQQ